MLMKECLHSLRAGAVPSIAATRERTQPSGAVAALTLAGHSQDMAVVEMIKLGYTVEHLKHDRWNSKRFQRQVADSHVKLSEGGYKYADLIELGYTHRLLRRYGIE